MKQATLYLDGGTYPMNPGHGGAGAVLILDSEEKHSFSQYLGEKKTNNQAEYGGLLLDDLPVCEPREDLKNAIAQIG